MKAFNEKCDTVLRFLNATPKTDWKTLADSTGIGEHDAIVSYLQKHKGFVNFGDDWIEITQSGKEFISTTSFVAQRD